MLEVSTLRTLGFEAVWLGLALVTRVAFLCIPSCKGPKALPAKSEVVLSYNIKQNPTIGPTEFWPLQPLTPRTRIDAHDRDLQCGYPEDEDFALSPLSENLFARQSRSIGSTWSTLCANSQVQHPTQQQISCLIVCFYWQSNPASGGSKAELPSLLEHSK